MSVQSPPDKAFQIIMSRFIESGQAPHYTEIAAEMSIPVENGRKLLHELFSPPFPGWLASGTDYIGSFPPFSHIPTQYRITIEGKQKWTAQ